MSNESVLTITGMGVPPYSVRGAVQTLTHIPGAAQLRRTVNGSLTDVSVSQLRKYRSTITCRDQDPPAVDQIWPGQQVTVECIVELAYETSTAGPGRTAVAGTSRVDGAFTFYRPELTMMVAAFEIDKDEWGSAVGWTLELEEV